LNNKLKYGELGDLSNSSCYHQPIDIGECPVATLQKYLQEMLRIRKVEQKLAEGRRDGLIGGPVHLGVGQEAVAVGVSAALRISDRIFGAHRSHSHLLALGSDVCGLFAEVLGKDTGLSRGMGGSMHLWDQSRGFYGSVPIVAGTVSLAVGAALAAKMQNNGDVAVAYFGDGAIEEGVVNESLNLAKVLNVPILFVLENNLFSSHMHISIRQPHESTARFAQSNDIPFHVVDGNDVLAVADAATEFIDAARAGKGPGFIEAVTFRWYGHVDWREDIDVGINRSLDDMEKWRARDPVKRLRQAMALKGYWTDQQNEECERRLDEEITQAWEQAMNDPYPQPEALLGRVYAP
jgi:pyruvate dehydrogenase E1 component alpha subunit